MRTAFNKSKVFLEVEIEKQIFGIMKRAGPPNHKIIIFCLEVVDE